MGVGLGGSGGVEGGRCGVGQGCVAGEGCEVGWGGEAALELCRAVVVKVCSKILHWPER